MNKKELIQQICLLDQWLKVLSGPRNNDICSNNGNSIGKVISILGSSKEEIHPTDLCRVLGVTTPRITTILNEMENKGLIMRTISSQDRRKIIVVLTNKGKKIAEEKNRKRYDFFERVYEKIGPEDAEAMYRSMKALEEVSLELKKEREGESPVI